MKSTSLKSLAIAGLTKISAVRVNVSGYKFVTFYSNRGTQQMYLSKAASEVLNEGDFLTREQAAIANICLTVNAAGVDRFKLSISGGKDPKRTSMSDLFDDIEEVVIGGDDAEVVEAVMAEMKVQAAQSIEN
jgi:hypothetical protein